MEAKVIKDATLTIKAGQIVNLDEKQFALAFKLGLVEVVQKEKPKKKAK